MSSTAQRQQTNDNPELREKIVQVLSSTVNGCLSELGYYPGIGQQLHEALKANNHLQQANDKLFEDNRALARLAALQNDRLALVDGTEHSRLKTYTDMESMVKVLTAEKAELMKRNSLFVQSLPTSDVLKNLQASHNNLQREYLRLRESYNSLYKTSASHNIFPGKQVPWSNLLESSNSNYQISGGNTNTYHQRVSECKVPADGMTSFTNQSQVPLTAQQRKAPSQGSYAQRSTSGQEPHGSRAGPSLQHSRGPPSWTTLAQHQETNALVNHPNIAVSDRIGRMYPISNSNTQKGKGKDPLTPLALDARNLPTTPAAQQQNPHRYTLQGQSIAAHAGQPQQRSTGLVEETHAQESATHAPIIVDRGTASQNFAMLPLTSSSEVPLAELLGAPTTLVNLAQEDGVDQRQLLAQESIDISGKYSLDLDPKPPQEHAFDTAMHTNVMANYTSHEQGDATNGEALVSEEDCVATIFEDDEGKQSCSLCTMRFEKGLVEEPPKVFLHGALDVLVAHCVEEHLVVWEKLRHSPPCDD